MQEIIKPDRISLQGVIAWSISLLLLAFFFSEYFLEYMIGPDPRLLKGIWIPRIVSLGLVVCMVFVLFFRKNPIHLFKENSLFNLFILITFFLLFLLSNRLQPGQHKIVRLFLVFLLVLQSLRLFYLSIVKPGRPEIKWKSRFATALLGLGMLFFIGEAIFIFVAETSGHLMTFAAINWAHRYQNPINTYRYRDVEPDFEKSKDRSRIIFLGDSFTEGGGIKKIENRFSNLIGEKLGEEYQVFNLGKGGADTRREYELLDSFPVGPDLLVLGYFGNDILGVLPPGFINVQLRTEYYYLPQVIRFFVFHSHFLDYLCWKMPWKPRGDFLGELEKAYRDPETWARHTDDLQKIIAYSERHESKMAVLIFPYIQGAAQSTFFAKPVGDFFRSQGIPVLDLQPILVKYNADQMVVNGNDAHPNEFVHQLAADSLHHFLKKRSLIPRQNLREKLMVN